MIPCTQIHDPKDVVDGWLLEYCKEVGGNRYPWSFHVATALMTLGAIVGRRAAIRQSTYTMWPPVSVILLGASGVGKSQSLEVGRRVVAAAAEKVPFLIADKHAFFSPRGLMDKWIAAQEAGAGVLEGVEMVGELDAVLKPKATGNERVCSWINGALEHEDEFKDTTSGKGVAVVRNMTVSMAFAGVLDTLVESVPVSQFAGGFMHRFLVVYELWPENRAERQLLPGNLKHLAKMALMIRDNAPKEMEVEEAASVRLQAYGRLAADEPYGSHHMSGWYNRVGSLTAKLALLLTLSRGEGKVTLELVERAHTLLQYFFRPLEGIIEWMAAGPKERRLLGLHQDLVTARHYGMAMEAVGRKLGNVVDGATEMMRMGLLSVSERTGKAYANDVYRVEGERDEGVA